MSAVVDYSEEVEWLLPSGESVHQIALQLGISPASLSRSLRRHGRPDLARPFGALGKRERRVAA